MEFREGKAESSVVEKIGSKIYLRFMEPMFVEEGCLKCHSMQGYKVGDIRGGSVYLFQWADISEFTVTESAHLFYLT